MSEARFLTGREAVLVRDALEAYRPVLVQRAGVLARLGRGEGVEADARAVGALAAALEGGAQLAVLAPSSARPAFSASFLGSVA